MDELFSINETTSVKSLVQQLGSSGIKFRVREGSVPSRTVVDMHVSPGVVLCAQFNGDGFMGVTAWTL